MEKRPTTPSVTNSLRSWILVVLVGDLINEISLGPCIATRHIYTRSLFLLLLHGVKGTQGHEMQGIVFRIPKDALGIPQPRNPNASTIFILNTNNFSQKYLSQPPNIVLAFKIHVFLHRVATSRGDVKKLFFWHGNVGKFNEKCAGKMLWIDLRSIFFPYLKLFHIWIIGYFPRDFFNFVFEIIVILNFEESGH